MEEGNKKLRQTRHTRRRTHDEGWPTNASVRETDKPQAPPPPLCLVVMNEYSRSGSLASTSIQQNWFLQFAPLHLWQSTVRSLVFLVLFFVLYFLNIIFTWNTAETYKTHLHRPLFEYLKNKNTFSTTHTKCLEYLYRLFMNFTNNNVTLRI